MSKFGIALMTAAAISLLSGCQAAKEKHPTQEELIRQMQQRAAAPDTHTLPPGKATQDQLMRYAFTLREAVMVQLPNSARYQGKICSVRLSLNRSAKLTGLQQEGGDPAFLRGSDRCGTAHDLPALCQRRGLPDL
ncbi:Tol-Pal system TolA [Klebsiella variicola]|nr:cell envelope integrity TolA C-terminal domain-containing protein [Klebsiella variicola]VEC96002.1 Tol-Pal system TolA [Klebsiella variicola]